MALTIAVKITGAPEGIEKNKMERMVSIENKRRADALAALDPQPERVPAELAELPAETNVDLKNSYEVVLIAIMVAADEDYNRQTMQDEDYGVTKFSELRESFATASEAKRLQVKQLLES